MFQSTPGIAAGRIRAPAHLQHRKTSFNPRPALLPGESSINQLGISTYGLQSTPGIAAGRIGCTSARLQMMMCFNPRPALLPGESLRGQKTVGKDGFDTFARTHQFM